MEKRVVITGLGAITPIGKNINENWESIENKKCGIDNITLMDTTNFKTSLAGEVKEYNPLTQTLVPIISVTLDMSEMEDLMDLVYFIFLIDLEPENQLIPINNMSPSEYTRYVKDNMNHA